MATTLDWKKLRRANAKAAGSVVNFKSRFPSCTVTMLDSHFSGYKMRLPTVFSSKINVKKGELILKVGEKSWNISYLEDLSRINLSAGWIRFARENCLKIGDVCGFELLPATTVVTLRVTIFRSSGEVQSGSHQSVHDSFQRVSSSFPSPTCSATTDVGKLKPEKPHFFKVICDFSEALQENKLFIPRKFVRLYGHDMARYVQVKDPSGKEWRMECSKSDGDVWFTNGWEDFANYYSIVHGHVLFFQYEGNSQFSVFLIDKSGTEIMYPLAGDTEETDEETDEDTESDGGFAGEKCKQRSNLRREKSKGDGKDKAFEKAASFNSENPFFFIVMQPSFIDPISARLLIPPAFYIEFVDKDEGDASLYANGRRWNVKYLYRGKGKSKKPKFGAGWKTFADQNSLEAGDVCAFELIGRTNVEFQVHIFRGNENTDPSPGKHRQDTHEKDVNKKPKTRDVQQKERKTIELLSSENPFFRVFMEPRFLNSPYLDIPMDFVKNYLKQEITEVLLKVGRRLWSVQFCPPSRFCNGWDKFVQDNSLQERDTCIFELTDNINMVVEVHIYGSV